LLRTVLSFELDGIGHTERLFSLRLLWRLRRCGRWPQI